MLGSGDASDVDSTGIVTNEIESYQNSSDGLSVFGSQLVPVFNTHFNFSWMTQNLNWSGNGHLFLSQNWILMMLSISGFEITFNLMVTEYFLSKCPDLCNDKNWIQH